MRAYCCTLNTGERTLESVLLHTQHKGRGNKGRMGGQIGLLLSPAWQGPRCRHRLQERKEEEERDNETEDPGERTVAHSTQVERKEAQEGRTKRPAAPPDCTTMVQTQNELLSPVHAQLKLCCQVHPALRRGEDVLCQTIHHTHHPAHGPSREHPDASANQMPAPKTSSNPDASPS